MGVKAALQRRRQCGRVESAAACEARGCARAECRPIVIALVCGGEDGRATPPDPHHRNSRLSGLVRAGRSPHRYCYALCSFKGC